MSETLAAAWNGLLCACLCIGAATAETTLRVAMPEFPPGRGNPHTEHVDYLPVWAGLFDPLTVIKADGTVGPWLATGWTRDDDLTWTFKLRDGVRFSNGVPFDADAVAATVAYFISPASNVEIIKTVVPYFAEVQVLDPLTVRIRTKEPRPMLPHELDGMRIVEPGAWKTLGRDGFAAAPIGTGPFKVERWAANTISLTAVPTSWRRPRIDRIVFSPVPQNQSRVGGILSGEFDIAINVDPDDRELLESVGGRIYVNFNGSVQGIMLNNVKDPRLADPRVRKALNLAVDKDGIVKTLLAGLTETSGQPASKLVTGYNKSIAPFPYDPAAAKTLLAEAGLATGLSMLMEVSNQSAVEMAIYQKIADDLGRVGVEVKVEVLPHAVYLDTFRNVSWKGSLFPNGYYSINLDGFEMYRGGNSCNGAKPWYCDQAIMPLVRKGLGEPNAEARRKMAQDLMVYAHDTAQGLYLFEKIKLIGLGKRVSGYEMFRSFVPYERVSLSE